VDGARDGLVLTEEDELERADEDGRAIDADGREEEDGEAFEREDARETDEREEEARLEDRAGAEARRADDGYFLIVSPLRVAVLTDPLPPVAAF
jgi:hypothetical protein